VIYDALLIPSEHTQSYNMYKKRFIIEELFSEIQLFGGGASVIRLCAMCTPTHYVHFVTIMTSVNEVTRQAQTRITPKLMKAIRS
jgi:hypothetical protein